MARFFLGYNSSGKELWRDSPGGFPYVDLRGKIPGASRPNQGQVYKTAGVINHYNGPKVLLSDIDQLYVDARYHMRKNWGTWSNPAYVNGIQYEWAVGADGTKYRLRDPGAVLWHCGAAENETAIAVTFIFGEGQHATAAAKQSAAELNAALCEIQGLSRAYAKGHQEVNPTACPGSAQAEFVRPFRSGEDFRRSPSPAPKPTPVAADKIRWVNLAFHTTDGWARKIAGAMAEAFFAVGVRGGITPRFVKAANDARTQAGVYSFIIGAKAMVRAKRHPNLDSSVRLGPRGKVRGTRGSIEATLREVARWRVAAFCEEFGLDKQAALRAFSREMGVEDKDDDWGREKKEEGVAKSGKIDLSKYPVTGAKGVTSHTERVMRHLNEALGPFPWIDGYRPADTTEHSSRRALDLGFSHKDKARADEICDYLFAHWNELECEGLICWGGQTGYDLPPGQWIPQRWNPPANWRALGLSDPYHYAHVHLLLEE